MRVLFMGTGEIALPTFKRLADSMTLVGLVTQPDRPVGRRSKPQPPRIKEEALARSIPVLQPEDVRRESEISAIAVLDPELIVVMAYGQILTKALLAVPSLGCFNIHASLLPRHRGASCIQAAIAAGDRESGISIIKMVERLDAGDVVMAERIGLSADETGGSLHDRLGELAPELTMVCIEMLAGNTLTGEPQDHELATYAPQLQRLDGQLDWGLAAEVLERQIRAYEPWPGSYTHFKDGRGRPRRLKVFADVSVSRDVRGVAPGKVLSVSSSGITVACGDGALILNELQIEGGRRLSAAELIRGNAVEVGEGFFSLVSSP
jgi:methionyl-tRNA formyltransferase